MSLVLPGTRPIQELLTQQFYEWEMWGRGWIVNEAPVRLEPPFSPFRGHVLTAGAIEDDGVRKTLLSSIAGGIMSFFNPAEPPQHTPISGEEEREVEYATESRELVELSISLPCEDQPSVAIVNQVLGTFIHCKEPVGFEIVATPQEIGVQLVADERDAKIVTQQFKAHFPTALLTHTRESLREKWERSSGTDVEIVQFGLDREFFLPLRFQSELEADLLTSICGAWDFLERDEMAVFQVLFTPARKSWSSSLKRALTNQMGKPFFASAPETLTSAEKKLCQPLYAVSLRVASKATGDLRSRELVRSVAGSLNILADATGNRLVPLAEMDDEYARLDHEQDLLNRASRRFGMLLNAAELVSLVHFPSATVKASRLVRRLKPTKTAPLCCCVTSGIIIGVNEHEGAENYPVLTPDQRLRHVHIVGNSGTGKSTLLLNLITQDIEQKNGVAVLDPHGDLIDDILPLIPRERWQDVVLFDAADEQFPIGFNILSAHSDLEKTLLASDLVDVFRRLSTSFGDQMRSVLGNAILAFLESEKGGTLPELRRFLIEASFRKEFISTVKDPEVVYYWEREFPLLKTQSIGPLLTRLDEFLRRKAIRYIVGQRENKLDFRSIMDNRRIFLGRLPQGLIGEENSFMLGSLLVSKFHQLAISRQEKEKTERPPFFLYLDEFHHFTTPTLETILSGGRKYGLSLTLAHQGVHQLENAGSTGKAVLSLSGTRICFRVGDSDARKLGEGFSAFDQSALQGLDNYEAICRVDRREQDFNIRTIRPSNLDKEAETRRNLIRAETRRRYGTPRADIEAELAKFRHLPPEETKVDPFNTRTKQTESTSGLGKAPEAAVAEVATKPSREQATNLPITNAAQNAQTTSGSPNETIREHESIKKEIEREAELLNYVVVLEKEVLEGKGRIDVVIEAGNAKIACEISVTTTIEHEVRNVEKCMAAGFREIFVICTSKRRLSHIKKAVEKRFPAELTSQGVRFQTPGDFLSTLREKAQVPTPPNPLQKQGINLLSGGPDTERKKREQQMLRELTARMRRARPVQAEQN